MSKTPPTKPPPLVYSCSGCSSAAQMANYLAIQLDRRGVAEMSCIAGVGGDVPQLVNIARSGRPIVAIDGCPLRCVAHSLARHGLTPQRQVTLSEFGVRRKAHEDFDRAEAARLLEDLSAELDDGFGSGLDDAKDGWLTPRPAPGSSPQTPPAASGSSSESKSSSAGSTAQSARAGRP